MFPALSERLDALVPDHLKAGSEESVRQAKLLVWLTVGLAPLHLLAATISTLIRGPNHLAAILLSGGTMVLVTLVFMRRSRNLMAPSVWFLSTNVVAVSLVAWAGYGPLSPAAHTFVLFPVVGMVLGGLRLAVPFTVVSVTQIGALVVADQMGFQFPLDPAGDRYLVTYTLVMSSVVVIVIAFLASYDAAWRDASRRSGRAQAELRRSNEAKSAFLANMSHELRTPLHAVIGYTELLIEDAPQHRKDLERIEYAGRHLVEIVDEVLDLARIESGRLELTTDEVDLDQLTSVVFDQVRPIADQNSAALVREVDAPLVATTDPTRVKQVLLNLLSNACKFTREGTVTLRAARVGGHVHIEVEDTGVGMTSEELARIFEPFEQGAAGANRGTGLGLAISRHICEGLGGTLTAESVPGVGTRFSVVLP